MSDKTAITFQATDLSIRTMKDGGYRITMDLGENDRAALKQLVDMAGDGKLLGVAITIVSDNE